jgi:alkylation response protein AidB-like acyl-CoA dehydrogenase
MDLDLSEEQLMLRDMVRGVCSSYANLEAVRALEDDPVGYSDEFWKQLAALDLLGLMLPAQYGGSEMTLLEGAVVYMELGRSLSPSPHFVSSVMSAGLLQRAGTDDQKNGWLPRIASGDAVISTAWLEPAGGFGPRGIQTRATPVDGGYVLDGVKWHVPFAQAATQLVVLARNSDRADDIDAFLVDPTAPGVVRTQQKSIASDTQFEVEFTGVKAERIGSEGGGWGAWNDTMLDGAILLAAQAAGGASYALEITTQYAKDREQFDKPLGAFQAIAHYLADAATAVDGAETLVYEAAWARSEGRDVARLAPMAKLFACSTFRDVTAMAQQVFGGVGFTVEYDIQLFFRRAKQLQISWWDDRHLEELIASAVLD